MLHANPPFVARAIVLALALSSSATAQPAGAHTFEQWGNLEPGPFAVGFTVEHTHDHARSYRPRIDAEGRVVTTETGRPIRITLWYPGRRPSGARPLRYREYVLERETDLGPRTLTAEDGDRTIDALTTMIRPSWGWGGADGRQQVRIFPDDLPAARVERMMATRTAAFRDLPPVQRRFPVLLFIGPTHEQNVLFEYLASHGYVVAAIPDIGTAPAYYGLDFPDSATRQQVKADDLAFVIAHLRARRNVDATTVAAFATAGGRVPAILLQARRAPLKALVVEGSAIPELTQDEIARIRVPWLGIISGSDLASGPPEPARIQAFHERLQSLRYAEQYVLRFDQHGHPEFAVYRRAAYPERSSEHRPYEVIARYTKNFLDAHLKGNAAAKTFLRQPPEAHNLAVPGLAYETRPAVTPVPTQEEFMSLVRNHPDVAAVTRLYERVKQQDPAYRIFPPGAVPTMAQLARRRPAADSIALLKLAVEAYPSLPAAHSAIADAYARDGPKEPAIRHLEEALEWLEKDTTLTPQQKAQNQANWRRRLEQLKGST